MYLNSSLEQESRVWEGLGRGFCCWRAGFAAGHAGTTPEACVGVIPSAHQYGPQSKMEKGLENLLQCSLKYLMFLEDSPKSWVLFCWVLPDD